MIGSIVAALGGKLTRLAGLAKSLLSSSTDKGLRCRNCDAAGHSLVSAAGASGSVPYQYACQPLRVLEGESRGGQQQRRHHRDSALEDAPVTHLIRESSAPIAKGIAPR
jgi:hypothetical protein